MFFPINSLKYLDLSLNYIVITYVLILLSLKLVYYSRIKKYYNSTL